MWQKIKTYALAHLIGLGLIVGGWFMCIVGTGWDRWTSVKFLSGANLMGLILILLGAYFPEIWISIKNRGAKS